MRRFFYCGVGASLLLCLTLAVRGQAPAKAEKPALAPSVFDRVYSEYKPDFLDKTLHEGGRRAPSKELMDLSSESSFFSLNLLQESDRAYALVAAAKQKEAEREYGEALDIYQKVIDEYPDELYRVSSHGVFVPITHYVQLRMLGFPRASLAHYRTKHDARAAEAFNLAKENNSLEGLAYVRDFMLATSYGARAMTLLGDAALDRGHYLEALEYYGTVRDHFPDPDAQTPELNLKIAYCHTMLGEKAKPSKPGAEGQTALTPENLKAFRQVVSSARYAAPKSFTQKSSPPNLTADDYLLMPPTLDPMGLKTPVWAETLPGSRLDFYVYANPVVTPDSVVYRHKNIVYCRSLLNGRLRWMSDTGGRVTWQNWDERQYPHEDVLVQDGLVVTTMHQVGPTLVALDEITGQLRWAYGPMVATTADEANMRFEAAPAGGPMTVFAGYIQDNIEGSTHTDTEYGVIAFDSATGRIRWRQHLCRMRPGLFVAGTSRRRNRIRSFASPPLYHEGTVYHITNAGAVAALDALSGRIKWMMRYPYYYHPDAVHDAMRRFGGGGGFGNHSNIRPSPHSPMFWYGQRPVLIGEDLYVLPINSKFMYKLDRRSGKVHWTANKWDGASYFLGPLPDGKLLMANSGRSGRTGAEGPIAMLDPKTGKMVGRLEDPVAREPQPTIRLNYSRRGTSYPVNFQCMSHDRANYQITTRPFLSSNGQLIVGGFSYWAWPIFGFGTNLAAYSLDDKDRPVTARRRYFSGQLLANNENTISESARWLESLDKLPNKDKRVLEEMEMLRSIIADDPTINEHPMFIPFARMTFERFGTPFEFRFGPRTISMVYDLDAVKRDLAKRKDAETLFGSAEVAIHEGRMDEAADLMQRCLAVLPSEDTDFRTLINQQLYQVHVQLARGSVRAGNADEELAHCLGMSRTATTLGNELEMRFAIADAYERKGDYRNAGLQLQSVVSTYGHYGYPVSSLLGADAQRLSDASSAILKRGGSFGASIPQSGALGEASGLLSGAIPIYFGALSPLEKDLTMRAGEWAVARLNRLRMNSETFAAAFEKTAAAALAKKPAEEQLARLLEFPGTRSAQEALASLLTEETRGLADEKSLSEAALRRRRLWNLADMARIGGLALPTAHASRLGAPPLPPPALALKEPLKERTLTYEEERGPAWLVLERRGQMDIEPNMLFMGGRVRTRFDNKFLLYAVDAQTGETRWKAREQRGETWFDELRLDALGDEPGFFEAYVHGDAVVTHGRYDVLAFRLKDGTLKWRYRVPFAFEIRHSVLSGDLLALAGQSETVALYLGTDDPRGEVAWQEREEGDLYGEPYFHGERFVTLRAQPFGLTTRSRATGRLIGRLSLPDLTLLETDPLVENGPEILPRARDGGRLLVTDGWYYIMLDVELMRIVWKRLIDNNDMTTEPPFRFEMNGDYLAVVKKDHDVNAIYMLSSRTGEALWRTDAKDAKSPRPIHSMLIRDGKLYGIRPHAGQGFYFVGMDCATGKDLFRPNEQTGYGGRPDVRLRPVQHGSGMIAEIRDRQDFELKAFDIASGKLTQTVKMKAAGDFGEHGRASATVQNGAMALMGGHSLALATP